MPQNILSILPGRAGLDRAAQGVLGAGRRLADATGGTLLAIVIGPGEQELARGAAAVADKVTRVDHPLLAEYHPEVWLTALATICQMLDPLAVLLGNDTYSQELAPRLAHRLKGSAAGDAVEVTADRDRILVKRGVYGGKAVAQIALARRPAIVWVRARAMPPAQAADRSTGEIQTLQLDLKPDERVVVLSRQVEAKEGVRLEDARVIVSGGRGLGGPEPFKELQALATVMGAEMAASRAACDAGWVPASWQVGQTGKKVAPELYLAIAISGASQHIMGIADAKVICAINRDSDAPIFKHCQFGLVEDYQKVVGPLRERLGRSS
jgi:electron transfer flavoprotein alpha subunit